VETQLTKCAALAVFAVAGMLLSAALAAESKGPFAVPEVAVEYGDLDLTKPEGVQALHRRLKAAAERVCPRTDGRVKLEQKILARECRKQALEHAVREIGSPELAALHAATAPRG
jgi:UrcA family protein